MSKLLSNEEAEALILSLQIKFKAQADKVHELIKDDIKRLGFISLSTSNAQKKLIRLIEKEKENHET